MAFVNEYIAEADYEKYDLYRIGSEHNEANSGGMLTKSWTMDREHDCFLLKLWSHHSVDCDGMGFYWKGNWIFFDLYVIDVQDKPEKDACSFHYEIRRLRVPDAQPPNLTEIKGEMQAAFEAYVSRGVFSKRANRSVLIDFIGA